MAPETAATGAEARFLDALLHGDRRAAALIVDATLEANGGLRALYLDLIQPALREVGRLWQENEITVADEHLATAIVQSVMGRAFEREYVWRGEKALHLVAACADDERHQIGLRMVCDLLELQEWETTYLGASVPIASLVEFVGRHAPHAVAISASVAPSITRVRSAIAAIRAAPLRRQPVIVVGGRAFLGDPTLAARIGADGTAADAWDAVALLHDRLAERA